MEQHQPPTEDSLYYSWRTKNGVRLNLVMNEREAGRWAELKGLEIERMEGTGMTRRDITSSFG